MLERKGLMSNKKNHSSEGTGTTAFHPNLRGVMTFKFRLVLAIRDGQT
jgi:hypothetical protein